MNRDVSIENNTKEYVFVSMVSSIKGYNFNGTLIAPMSSKTWTLDSNHDSFRVIYLLMSNENEREVIVTAIQQDHCIVNPIVPKHEWELNFNPAFSLTDNSTQMKAVSTGGSLDVKTGTPDTITVNIGSGEQFKLDSLSIFSIGLTAGVFAGGLLRGLSPQLWIGATVVAGILSVISLIRDWRNYQEANK